MTKSKDKFAVGVDIGGTNIKLGIISDTGKIVKKALVETKGEGGPDVVVSQIKKGINELLSKNDRKIICSKSIDCAFVDCGHYDWWREL